MLGTHEGMALLLTPAHLLSDIGEIGREGSRNGLEIRVGKSLERFSYSQIRLHVKRSPLEDAVLNDYLIVEIPVGFAKRGAVANLTWEHLRRPERNQPVLIYSAKPQGGWSSNKGAMESIRGKEVASFEIKTDKVIEEGESGSPVLGEGDAVYGILVSSDGKVGRGVFPTQEVDFALQTIGWSKDNRESLHGLSLSLVPTYQYSSKVQDQGGGNTHTETQHGGYVSFELEYFGLTRPAGEQSAFKYGLIAGYSGGSGHGLGQVDGADYTLKYGLVVGSVDRVKDNTGQLGLFALSHRVGGKFVNRLGVSFEATTQLSVRSHTALDAGVRIEINDLSFSGGASMGLGLVLRYSWLRAL